MNKIIILAVVFAALTGVGILGNMIFLQIQPLGMFASLDELPGSICSCADASGEFSPLNCEQFLGDFSDSPDMKCEAIAPGAYGNPPLLTQGCSVDFWMSHGSTSQGLSVWPTGYSPGYYFNEMFQVNMKLPEQVDNGKAKNDDKGPKQENDKVTNKNKVNDDEKENNGKKVKDETGKGSTSIETAENETIEEILETDEEVDGSTVADEEEVDGSTVTDEEVDGSTVTDEEVDGSTVTDEEVDGSTVADEEEVEKILETDEEEKAGSGNVIISEPKKGLNLLRSLHLQGSQLNELVRESVAAMLNAAHPEIDYTYSVAEIISMTQIAMANEEYDDTITMLKQANVRGNTPICLT